jgi:hypothetical protein
MLPPPGPTATEERETAMLDEEPDVHRRGRVRQGTGVKVRRVSAVERAWKCIGTSRGKKQAGRALSERRRRGTARRPARA